MEEVNWDECIEPNHWMDDFLLLREIVRALLGDSGVNTITEIFKPKSSEVRARSYGQNKYENNEDKRNTQSRVFNIIRDALLEGEIFHFDDFEFLRKGAPLLVEVDMNSLLLWFKKNREKQKQINFNLGVLSREFPKAWTAELEKIQDEGEQTQIERKEIKPLQQNKFSKDGEVWKLYFSGQELPSLNDLDGLRYIWELIKLRGTELPEDKKELAAQALYAAVKGSNPNAANNTQVAEVLSSDNFKGHEPMLTIDDKTIRDVRTRLEDLEQEQQEYGTVLQGGDPEKYMENESEIEKLKDYLAKNTNKRGKPRVIPPREIQNAENTVRNAIKRAIKKIEMHSPDMARYLNSMITTGKKFSYNGGAINWEL